MSQKNILKKIPSFRIIEGKMRIIDALNALAGFSGVAGQSPYLKTIKLIHYNGLNSEGIEDTVDFYKLLYTYPPFEPVPWPKTQTNDLELRGNRIWFMDVEELDNSSRKRLIRNWFLKRLFENLKLRKELISPDIAYDEDLLMWFGDYVLVLKNRIILKSIITFRIPPDAGWYLDIKFTEKNSKRARKYWISYGVRFLKRNLNERGISLKNWEEKISKEIWLESFRKCIAQKNVRSPYDPLILNYVYYCFGGRYLSSDPCAVGEECPVCMSKIDQYSYLCYNVSGRKIFGYKRRIFPKFYARVNNFLLEEFKPPALPFEVKIISNKELGTELEKIITYWPPYGEVVEFTPKKKPFTRLGNTNGIAVLIDEDVVTSLVEFSKNYTIAKYIYKNGKVESIRLYDALISKYLFMEILGDPYRVIMDYHKDRKSNQRKFKGYLIDKYKNLKVDGDPNFYDFVGKTLVHTLSHVLFKMISDTTEIGYDDLIYAFGTSSTKDDKSIYYAAVLEKNDFGTLNLDDELQKIFLESNNKSENLITAFSRTLRDYLYSRENGLFTKSNVISEENMRLQPTLNEVMEELSKIRPDLVEPLFNLYHFIKDLMDFLVGEKIIVDYGIFKQLVISIIRDSKKSNIIIKEIMGVDRVDENVEKVFDDLISNFLEEAIIIASDQIHYCYDGCSYDVGLGKMCSQGIYENLVTSRSLLELFLKVSGVNPDDLKVKGEAIYTLTRAAKKKVSIHTTFMSKKMGIDLIERLLEKGVNIELIIDRREYPKHKLDLEKLAEKYPGLLKHKSTEFPDHGKSIDIDYIHIITSWNYGTGGSVLQNYIANLKNDLY